MHLPGAQYMQTQIWAKIHTTLGIRSVTKLRGLASGFTPLLEPNCQVRRSSLIGATVKEMSTVSKSHPRGILNETYTMPTQRNGFCRSIRRRLLGTSRPAVLFELLRPIPCNSWIRGQAPHGEHGLNAHKLSNDLLRRGSIFGVRNGSHTQQWEARVYLECTGTSPCEQAHQLSVPPRLSTDSPCRTCTQER